MLEFWTRVFEKDGILDRFGFPILVVIGLSFAIWASVSWTAKNIAQPVAAKHIMFLEAEQEKMKVMADQSVRQTDQMAIQSEELRRQRELTELNTKVLREIRDDQRKFPAVADSPK